MEIKHKMGLQALAMYGVKLSLEIKFLTLHTLDELNIASAGCIFGPPLMKSLPLVESSFSMTCGSPLHGFHGFRMYRGARTLRALLSKNSSIDKSGSVELKFCNSKQLGLN